MTQRPPLPPLSKNTSPRKDKTLVAQTSRPMPIRNSLHQSPRSNLYQSSSSNKYEDPIENIKEYKRLSQQISSIKMSMIPLNEELIQLQSYFGPVTIDKEAENQQQELESLIKEKEDLDAKIASVRRTYNEHNYINQQAEINFLRSKLRRGDVILAKAETSVDKIKEERDSFLNSDTKTEIINAKKRAKELNKKLSSLRKEGDGLILQYCQKLTVITEGKDNDQQQINRRKAKIRKAKYEIESRKFELRRMKQKHEENVKDLKDRIKLKKAQKKKFNQSQNWKERTKVSFTDDGNKYNPYVTAFPVNYNQYKIVAPQDDTNSPSKEQNGAVNEDGTANKLGLMYQHFPNQLNKNFDNEEETDNEDGIDYEEETDNEDGIDNEEETDNEVEIDNEEDIDDDQEKDGQQLDKHLLEDMADKIADKLNDDNEQTTKNKNQRTSKTKQSKVKDTIHNEDGLDNEDLDVKSNDDNKENHDMDNNDEDKKDESQQSEDKEHKNEINNNDQKDKNKKQRKVEDSKKDNQSDEDSQEDIINNESNLSDEISNDEDKTEDDEISDEISNDEDKKEDDEISDDDSKDDSVLSDDENQNDGELDDEDSSDDNHPLDKIGSNIASSLKESGNNKSKPDEKEKKKK